MAIIENVRLMERRLETLRRRRARIAAPGACRAPLPGWAADALLQAGMTRHEIDAFNAAPPSPEEELDAEKEQLDASIEALEEEIMLRGDETLTSMQMLTEIVLQRLRRSLPDDPKDLFYDAGDARTLMLLERVAVGLKRLDEAPARQFG